MKPQLIFINGRFLAQSVTGVQRYAREVVLALDYLLERGEIDSKRYTFEIVTPPGVNNLLDLKHITFRFVGPLHGQAWEQLVLPVISRGKWLLSFCNVGPLLKRRQIVTVHDASVFAYPEAYSFGFRAWYQCALPALGKMAARILTDSHFSENELIKYCGMSPDKVAVVLLGVDHISRLRPDYNVFQKHRLGERPYILAASSLSPHKNFIRLEQAFNHLRYANVDIVVAGGANSKVFSNSRLSSNQANVHYLGYVSDGELRALYERAHCFVYPSLYEGFGLPPLEAMACRCPVIVSDAASLKEVCGEAALYCDPMSHKDIADKIELLLADAVLRDKLREIGSGWATRFQWVDTARAIWEETLRMIRK
jgi:glycosyltransferase involved in cell wall biosynthesis